MQAASVAVDVCLAGEPARSGICGDPICVCTPPEIVKLDRKPFERTGVVERATIKVIHQGKFARGVVERLHAPRCRCTSESDAHGIRCIEPFVEYRAFFNMGLRLVPLGFCRVEKRRRRAKVAE